MTELAVRIGEAAMRKQVDLRLSDRPHQAVGGPVLLRLADRRYADRTANDRQQVFQGRTLAVEVCAPPVINKGRRLPIKTSAGKAEAARAQARIGGGLFAEA